MVNINRNETNLQVEKAIHHERRKWKTARGTPVGSHSNLMIFLLHEFYP